MYHLRLVIFGQLISLHQIIIQMVTDDQFTVKYQRYQQGFWWGNIRVFIIFAADFNQPCQFAFRHQILKTL